MTTWNDAVLIQAHHVISKHRRIAPYKSTLVLGFTSFQFRTMSSTASYKTVPDANAFYSLNEPAIGSAFHLVGIHHRDQSTDG